jgi:hypothetical protein
MGPNITLPSTLKAFTLKAYFTPLRWAGKGDTINIASGGSWQITPANIAVPISSSHYSCSPFLQQTAPPVGINQPFSTTYHLNWYSTKDLASTSSFNERYPLDQSPKTNTLWLDYAVPQKQTAEISLHYHQQAVNEGTTNARTSAATAYPYNDTTLPLSFQTILNVVNWNSSKEGVLLSFPYFALKSTTASIKKDRDYGDDVYTFQHVVFSFPFLKAYSQLDNAGDYLSYLEMYRSLTGKLIYDVYNADPQVQDAVDITPWTLEAGTASPLATLDLTKPTSDRLNEAFMASMTLNRASNSSSSGIGASQQAAELGSGIQDALSKIKSAPATLKQNEVALVVLLSNTSVDDTNTKPTQDYTPFKQNTLTVGGINKPLHFIILAPKGSTHLSELHALNMPHLRVLEYSSFSVLKAALAYSEELLGLTYGDDERERYTNHILY